MSTPVRAVPWYRTRDLPGAVPSDATRCRNARDIRKEETTETSYGETAGVKPVRRLARSDNGSQSAEGSLDELSFVIIDELGSALSAGVGRSPERPRSLFSGPLKVNVGARALLTSSVKQLMGPLVAIARTKALRGNIEIASMELGVFVDPEDDSRELVLEIHTSALGPQALAYWDSLGAALNDWRAELSPAFADILAERLAVHVVWAPP